ncbi:MAG TPA: Npt1/Npt2 family nucleotide transporter [Burkholderiales bacterium]|nr:Npt1/Npt2 family nucleotide transporter [Burkholderiales bacterium]
MNEGPELRARIIAIKKGGTMSQHGDVLGPAGQKAPGSVYRVLKIFTDVKPGEAVTAFLLTLNVFLLLLAYYLIKPVREALVISSHGPFVRSSLAAAQAILFIFVVKGFSRLASKVPRHLLITWVTLFFISNLILFYLLKVWGVPTGTRAIAFFIWVGIFNIMSVAQFWSFAADIYTDEAGKRLFPMIAVGSTCGAAFGSKIAGFVVKPLKTHFDSGLMLMTAGVLGICIVLTIVIHNREIKKIRERASHCEANVPEEEKVKQQPLAKGGGFRLVFKSRYLLYYALLILCLNYVNYMGENIWGKVAKDTAVKAVEMHTTGGMTEAQVEAGLYADYQFLYNLIAMIVQLFLVSRIFAWLGIGGALLILPFVALGGYGLAGGLGVSLLLVKWLKGFENGFDYSLMNTTKGALFLVTSREEKYKGKAAADTFFYRTGDALAAVTFILGWQYLHLTLGHLAQINVAVTLVWILFCFLVVREYRRIKARPATAVASI